jgi:hypothetical protein
MTNTHQIPSIFHDAINTEHHIFALPRTILKHWADLDLIQPRLGENSRTASVRHPHLCIHIGWVVQDRFVMYGK